MSVSFNRFLREKGDAYFLIAQVLSERTAKVLQKEKAFKEEILGRIEKKVKEEFPDAGHEADVRAFLRRVRRAACVPGKNEEEGENG